MKGLLLNALEAGERLELIYMSDKNDLSQRVIKVLAVLKDEVQAYCYTRNQFRTFKMSNILSIGRLRNHKMGA